jgi:hypothetical protein
MKRFGRLVVGSAALLCGAFPGSVPFADDSSTASPDPGIWQKHEYTFQFMGFTTTYSCDGLADKVKVLLIAAGARSDSKSRTGVCSRSYGRPDKFAQANLTFYTLMPAQSARRANSPPATANSSSSFVRSYCRCSPRGISTIIRPASPIRNRDP